MPHVNRILCIIVVDANKWLGVSGGSGPLLSLDPLPDSSDQGAEPQYVAQSDMMTRRKSNESLRR